MTCKYFEHCDFAMQPFMEKFHVGDNPQNKSDEENSQDNSDDGYLSSESEEEAI